MRIKWKVALPNSVHEFAKKVAQTEKEEARHEMKDVFLSEFTYFRVLVAQNQQFF